LLAPPLTTIHQPCEQIGAVAVQTLLQRLREPDTPPREILLDAPLVVPPAGGAGGGDGGGGGRSPPPPRGGRAQPQQARQMVARDLRARSSECPEVTRHRFTPGTAFSAGVRTARAGRSSHRSRAGRRRRP
jgi:hypothetical protein